MPYEIATMVYDRKVYPSCHIALKKNWYSVLYMYRGKHVDVRFTESIVEIYHNHQRIASHTKFPDYVTNKYSTNPADMPDEFNKPEMNDERMLSWASTIGPNTREVIERVFRSVQIKEQGYNSALSILNLSKHYPNGRIPHPNIVAAVRIILKHMSGILFITITFPSMLLCLHI